jgi:hypothetical protein
MTTQRLTGYKKAGKADIPQKNLGSLPLRKKTGELQPLKIKMVQKGKWVLPLLNSWIEEDEKDSTKRNAEWKRLKKALDDERHSEGKLFN